MKLFGLGIVMSGIRYTTDNSCVESNPDKMAHKNEKWPNV